MATPKPKGKPKTKSKIDPISYYAAVLQEASLKRQVAARDKSHKEFDAAALQILKSQKPGGSPYG